MLEPRDIRHLKLDMTRLAAHQRMPPPRYVRTPRIGQYSAISDAIVSAMLGVSPEAFSAQLAAARRLGTSYIHIDRNNKKIGFTGATSLIKGPVIGKNLIVPLNNVMHSPELNEHIFISAFIRGPLHDGIIDSLDDVEIAGWTRASDVLDWKDANPAPTTFKSALQFLAMPCHALNPINTLDTVIRG